MRSDQFITVTWLRHWLLCVVSKRLMLTQLLAHHLNGPLDLLGQSRTQRNDIPNKWKFSAMPVRPLIKEKFAIALLFLIAFAFDQCERILSFITCGPLFFLPSLVCIHSLSPVAVKSYYRSISGRLVWVFSFWEDLETKFKQSNLGH